MDRLRTRCPDVLVVYLAVSVSVVMLLTMSLALSALISSAPAPSFSDPAGKTDIAWVADQNAQFRTLVWIASGVLLSTTAAAVALSRPLLLRVVAMTMAAETWIVAIAGWASARTARSLHVEAVFAGSVHTWATLSWVLAAITLALALLASRQHDAWPVSTTID